MSVTKSERKFRFWDNKLLFQNLEKALQIKEQIETLATENDLEDTSQLPDSVLDTRTLYYLVLCYEAMYDKLLEEELTQNVYYKSTSLH